MIMAAVNDRPRRRRQSWNRSHSDGFGPIKQVGIGASIGFPLMVVGMFMLAIAYSAGETYLWVLAGGLFAGGLLTAASGRIT
jgi:hypothetical protein